jgi:hypothetical protein
MRPAPVALLALTLPWPALAGDATYLPPRPPGTVAVYRGASANVAPPVAVYRGSAARPGYLAPPPEPPPVTTVGGERIWFADPVQDELVGCRLLQTFDVGVNVVECTRRSLPVD